MAGYDAKKVRDWANKITGRSLIPPPKKSKTRAEQAQEAADAELDKFDLNQQTAQKSQGMMQGSAGNALGALGAQAQQANHQQALQQVLYNQINYRTFVTGMNSLSSLLETPAEKQRREAEERRQKEEEERQKQIKKAAFKSQIDSLGNSESVRVQKPIPDYVCTLTGWRGWKVSGGRLQALGMSGEWIPKKAERAVCTKTSLSFSFFGERDNAGKHPAPHKDCTCGYWTFKTLDLLTEALEPYMEAVVVLGTVDVWGKVIDCENGYRSEFAYPKELWLLKPDLDYLGWTYGVPVRRMP